MWRATGCLCVLFMVAVAALPAEAQSPRSYWGVSGSFVPIWETNSNFKVVFDADELVLEGSELRIGFVRGRALAGEWGVSLVHRQIKEGSTVALDLLGSGQDPCPPTLDFSFQNCQVSYTTLSSTTLTGAEIHRFFAFATFADRVQVGMTLAGGASWFRGGVERTVVDSSGTTVEEVDAFQLMRPRDSNVPTPTGKAEISIAGIIGPALKIRGGGGVGFPGNNVFSVTLTYFFGI